jgi:NAD(P)-dependent dehydrogenase (short-subunit alcohol dehydrogenase family)
MPDLTGRVALVTGAAGGIGQVLARAFVGAGAHVVLADTHISGILRLQGELGADRTLAVEFDVSDPAACQDAVAQAISRFGGVDILINNAALGMSLVRADHMRRTVQIEDIAPDLWARFIAVNLTGPSAWPRPCSTSPARMPGTSPASASSPRTGTPKPRPNRPSPPPARPRPGPIWRGTRSGPAAAPAPEQRPARGPRGESVIAGGGTARSVNHALKPMTSHVIAGGGTAGSVNHALKPLTGHVIAGGGTAGSVNHALKSDRTGPRSSP